MNINIKHLVATALIGLSAATIDAQSPLSLYYLETIPQSQLDNAAMVPRANGYVSLLSVNAGFNSDVAIKDLLQNGTEHKWVHPLDREYDYSKLYNRIGDALNLGLRADISAMGFGFRSGRDYLSFQFSEKVVFQTGLASDLLKIADIGLPEGTMFDLSTMRIKAYAYKEFSLGYARELNEQLTVGVHVKPLFGQVSAMTDFSSMSMSIGNTQYDIAIAGDVYTSLPLEVYSRPGEFPDSVNVIDLETDEYISRYGTSFKNPGLAIDLGGTYDLNQWTFSAALNNLGFIHWSEDLNSLHSEGTYAFDGIEITSENWDSLDVVMEDVADELKDALTHNASHDAFNTGLTPSLYLGAQYHLNHAISMGAVSRSTFQKQNFRQEFALSANYNPYRYLTFNMNVNTRIKGGTYLGMGLAWYMGPMQVFFLFDNIPFKYSMYESENGDRFPVPARMKDFNLMAGINLVFGSKGYRDRPLIGKNY